MEPTPSPEDQPVGLSEQTAEVVTQLSQYGSLIVNSLYLIVAGMIVIFLLYKIASKFLYPRTRHGRLIKVIFGTLYALVLVITALLALRKIGLDVENIGQLAIICVLIGAVVTFFLVPFFPRLPFRLGHLIEVNGVLGFVDAISTFHTTIRKFDGTMVFVPNALLMASKISNISETPSRRIEMNLSVNTDCDIEESKAHFLRIMTEEERVLDEPAPAAFVLDANAAGVELLAFCWVKNKDWLKTRSDLWIKVIKAFMGDERVAMSLPQQEVYIIDDNDETSNQ
ncbi:mechanosensitive ion channel family protein [Gammaproteobacteria bacterium]|nr:mechanosensitive ion channel family protein [Gammaproteobacteria bacterium]